MHPKIDPVDVKTYEKNFGWVVGIFKHVKHSKLFICQGALINPKVVLAPGLCITNYDPIISQPKRNLNLPISHVEHNVVKIFYHWKSTHDDRTTVSKRNLIMMVLNIALIYYPAIGILQPSMERSVNYDECLLVSLFDHIRNPVILEKRNAKYMKVSKCQSKSFITPINEAKFPETPETILCAAFNQTIAKPLPIGSTLICRYNEDPATLFLAAMLLKHNQHWSKHVKIEGTASWINKTLNGYKKKKKLNDLLNNDLKN
ncbi:Protein of unknown function [Cotesia congregata]|uniref:Uncharacterized protein n=1 Tax=Cotesia congregata TaxID=51543 RepID=A0A8J2MYG5_COTCN|nr:Protein of unknown function [Cotesia congregata]